jgi:small subunit ribosomal protein S18
MVRRTSRNTGNSRNRMRSAMSLRPRKKRVCRWCTDKESCRDLYIDFKDVKKLSRFLTEQGKIIPRRTSGNCARSQRQLAIAVKRARHLALIPYIADIPR